jgi:protein tyrosine/serine phosphatase
MERDLVWDACWNVRDLGGHPTTSGKTTLPRRVIRAGNLSRLTQAGREALVAYGVRTVIDVRNPKEFVQDLDPFHANGPWAGDVEYVNEPLISDAEWQAIRDPEQLKRGYVVTFELSAQNIGRVLAAVGAAPPGGVVIHCHAGKERTGVVAALLLSLAGVRDDVIAEDYVASDRHLTHLYEEWAAREEDPEARSRKLRGFISKPAHILDPLEWIRVRGGIERYLAMCGLGEEQVSALRSRMLGAEHLADLRAR